MSGSGKCCGNFPKLVAGLVFCSFFTQAYGQFIVQPMIIEEQPRPGVHYKTELLLQNWSRTETQVISLKVIDLGQNENGSWNTIKEGDPTVDLSKLLSCRAWVKMAKPEIQVPPMGSAPVKIDLPIPRNARGFHSAAIVAQLVPRDRGDTGISMQVALVVPVLLSVQGGAERHHVTLNDAGLHVQAESGENSESTLVSLAIENTGSTYSRLECYARLKKITGKTSRVVFPKVDFQKVGIIPGSRINLKADLEQSLPSGHYQVIGALYVDGRRVKGVEKDIHFIGAGKASELKRQALISVVPDTIKIANTPGRVKTGLLSIQNESDQAVTIEIKSMIPVTMKGKVIGNTLAEDLSCVEWLDFTPKTFTLRSFGKRNVRLSARMPNMDSDHGGFYATLDVRALHADKSRAGRAEVTVAVTNDQITASPILSAKALKLARTTGSKYVVTSRFSNEGEVHVAPKATARLYTFEENALVAQMPLETNQDGIMLPFDTWDYSGEIDFSKLEPDIYILETAMEATGLAAAVMPKRKEIAVYREGEHMTAVIRGDAANRGGTGAGGVITSW
ncbi:hypothetical protein ACFL6U_10670 [Planctomycetota bacterium]